MAEKDNNDDWVEGGASREDTPGKDDKEEVEADSVAEVVGVDGEYFFFLPFCPEN